MNKKVDKIKDVLIGILSIVLIVYLILGVNSIAHGDKFGFFNLRFYISSSDSSDVSASMGDLIISRRTKAPKVKENDKIVYKRNNKVFVNKVVNEKIDNNENQLCVINNNEKVSIKDVDVVAKVLCTTKGFGNMAMFIKSPIGMLNMLMIALCIVIIIKKIISNKQESEQQEEFQTQAIEKEKVIDEKESIDNKDVNDKSKNK